MEVNCTVVCRQNVQAKFKITKTARDRDRLNLYIRNTIRVVTAVTSCTVA